MGWLGVDVGTSSTKAVVYSDAGQPIGSGRATTPWYTGRDGVEVDPIALRDSAFAAIEEAVAAAAGVAVGGVGITSMGETGVLVDGRGAPVAPAIAWHDVRDAAEAVQLARDVDPAAFTRRTGKPPTNQYALAKHRWLTTHVPASRTAVRRFNVAEWVARGLGADEVTERSLASRTGWLDLAREAFDAELLAWSGAAPSLMPPLVEAGRPVGAATHPLLAGAVITLAGHDHQAAAVGAGVTGAGDVLDSHGSAEAVLRIVPAGLAAGHIEALAAAGITTDLGVPPGAGRCSAARRVGWRCDTPWTCSGSPGPISPSSTPPRSPSLHTGTAWRGGRRSSPRPGTRPSGSRRWRGSSGRTSGWSSPAGGARAPPCWPPSGGCSAR